MNLAVDFVIESVMKVTVTTLCSNLFSWLSRSLYCVYQLKDYCEHENEEYSQEAN